MNMKALWRILLAAGLGAAIGLTQRDDVVGLTDVAE